MEYVDYYSETAVVSNVTTGTGQGTRNAWTVVQSINPWQGMAAVAFVWGMVAGIVNFRRYKKGQISKKDAIEVTASESVGMGVAAGAGIFADAALKTLVASAALPAAIPFVMGVTVTATSKIMWDCVTRRKMLWCSPQTLSTGKLKSSSVLTLRRSAQPKPAIA